MDESVITCDEIIEPTVPTNVDKKLSPAKQKMSIFYLRFY